MLVLISFEWSSSVYETTDCAELQRVRPICNFRPRDRDEPIKNYVKFNIHRRKGNERDFLLGNPKVLFTVVRRREQRKRNTCRTDRFYHQAVGRNFSQLFTTGPCDTATSKRWRKIMHKNRFLIILPSNKRRVTKCGFCFPRDQDIRKAEFE